MKSIHLTPETHEKLRKHRDKIYEETGKYYHLQDLADMVLRKKTYFFDIHRW